MVNINSLGFEIKYTTKEEVLLNIKPCECVLKYASNELRNNKELAMITVKYDDDELKYASEELRNDKDIVLEAVKQNCYSIKHASEELKNRYKNKIDKIIKGQ